MSRNAKNAKRMVAARAFSEQRKNGGAGPEQTEPKHGKDKNKRHYSTLSRTAPKKQRDAA